MVLDKPYTKKMTLKTLMHTGKGKVSNCKQKTKQKINKAKQHKESEMSG